MTDDFKKAIEYHKARCELALAYCYFDQKSVERSDMDQKDIEQYSQDCMDFSQGLTPLYYELSHAQDIKAVHAISDKINSFKKKYEQDERLFTASLDKNYLLSKITRTAKDSDFAVDFHRMGIKPSQRQALQTCGTMVYNSPKDKYESEDKIRVQAEAMGIAKLIGQKVASETKIERNQSSAESWNSEGSTRGVCKNLVNEYDEKQKMYEKVLSSLSRVSNNQEVDKSFFQETGEMLGVVLQRDIGQKFPISAEIARMMLEKMIGECEHMKIEYRREIMQGDLMHEISACKGSDTAVGAVAGLQSVLSRRGAVKQGNIEISGYDKDVKILQILLKSGKINQDEYSDRVREIGKKREDAKSNLDLHEGHFITESMELDTAFGAYCQEKFSTTDLSKVQSQVNADKSAPVWLKKAIEIQFENSKAHEQEQTRNNRQH